MEKCVTLLDFTEIDQTLQIHGEQSRAMLFYLNEVWTDYDGLGLTSRDANSKNAAAEVTNIFQSHYPELLVRFLLIRLTDSLILFAW